MYVLFIQKMFTVCVSFALFILGDSVSSSIKKENSISPAQDSIETTVPSSPTIKKTVTPMVRHSKRKQASKQKDAAKSTPVSSTQNAAIATPSRAAKTVKKLKVLHPPGVARQLPVVGVPENNSLAASLIAKNQSLPIPGVAKVPQNLQMIANNSSRPVRVIKTCPKCAPVVRDLTKEATAAVKRKVELTKELEEANKKLKQLQQESEWRTQALQFEASSLGKNGTTFCEELLTSDFLMNLFCGVKNTEKFDHLYKGVLTRFSMEDTEKLNLHSRVLSWKKQFLLTLIFIRTNPSFPELSCKFQQHITPSYMTDVLNIWLTPLAAWLKLHKITMSIKATQYYNFPSCFNSIGRNLRGILHKFEITRQKPTILEVGQTSPILKFLTLFSPNKEVIFVSEVVDDTVSDTDLFVESGVADLFELTNIFVDTQMLGVKEHVKFGVKVIQPPLPDELDTKQIEHVESVVENMLEYRIIQGPLARTLTKEMVDSIVIICAGLVNLSSTYPSRV